MGELIYCELDNRKLIKISGSEAEDFLQGILTCNLDKIPQAGAGFGGLLTPQGKILFDFFVVRENNYFLLEVELELVDELVQRLIFYRLRADVNFEIYEDELRIYAVWGGEIPLYSKEFTPLADPRMIDMGWRLYSKSAPDGIKSVDRSVYEAHRIKLGVPEGGIDYQYGNTFPHEALYDQTGGVDFSKGCYVGQEVVSRIQHRGTARKRIIQISSEYTMPEPGTKITVAGRSAGEITSVSDKTGLAILRLDHIGRALAHGESIEAKGINLIPQIQFWAKFDWPNTGQVD